MEVDYFPLMKLVNNLDKSQIYHYEGSLTTPPCSEIVSWIVIDDPQSISDEQVEYFANLGHHHEDHGHHDLGNNRAIQPLNNRQIYKKVEDSDDIYV